jgi:hypothetical protein
MHCGAVLCDSTACYTAQVHLVVGCVEFCEDVTVLEKSLNQALVVWFRVIMFLVVAGLCFVRRLCSAS